MPHTKCAYQGRQTIIHDNWTSTFINVKRCDFLINCWDQSYPHSSLIQILWSNCTYIPQKNHLNLNSVRPCLRIFWLILILFTEQLFASFEARPAVSIAQWDKRLFNSYLNQVFTLKNLLLKLCFSILLKLIMLCQHWSEIWLDETSAMHKWSQWRPYWMTTPLI
jgi:hypothetical protein